MSSYHGRRAPNVSQFIAELNTIPTTQELTSPEQPLSMDDEFALFTNTEFYDFDLGDIPELPQALDYDPVQEERARRQNASAFRYTNSKPAEPMTGDYSFPVYPNFVDHSTAANYPQAAQSGAPYPYPAQSSPTAASPNEARTLPGTQGGLSKLDGVHDPNSGVIIEESARVAAEEDKRRRNTAASARFRIKKKQREQALERSAKEMNEKVNVLESKVSQLEMENKWLKSLITEKSETKGEILDLYKQIADKKITGERSTGDRNDGVGTASDKAGKTNE